MTLNIHCRRVHTDIVLRTNSEEHDLHESCTSDTYPVVVRRYTSLLSWFSITHKQLTIACKLFFILIISVLLASKVITFLNLEQITYAVRLRSKYCKIFSVWKTKLCSPAIFCEFHSRHWTCLLRKSIRWWHLLSSNTSYSRSYHPIMNHYYGSKGQQMLNAQTKFFWEFSSDNIKMERSVTSMVGFSSRIFNSDVIIDAQAINLACSPISFSNVVIL